jgi:alpha-galactosidase/6-phospho-beta-glucosidase family protein
MENEDNEPGQFVAVMQAAADGKQYYLSANLPNGGRLPDLPEESCLEAPAVAEAGGVRPRPIAPLPAAITSMLASRLQWVEVLIEAAMEGSREKFVQALVLDGAVRDLGVAHQLADELLTAQQEYLPQFATTNEHVASQTHPTGPEVQALMTKGRSIA